jgi:hypothetical protein
MTFGYLRTLYDRVRAINDPRHTRDEYLVLFAKTGHDTCVVPSCHVV